MSNTSPILVTGAAGRVGAISPAVVRDLLAQGFPVRAMVRRVDERSEALRSAGAEVVVGSLTDLDAVHRAIEGCKRIYFSMSVDAAYLEATTNVAAVAKHHGIEALVSISQMTLSQMSITSTTNSPQHKQHWLGETVLRWSGLPVVYLRPTAFMDVFFLRFCAPTVREHDALMLPFGEGKTSPIAAADVARCVSAVLANPREHIGKVYDLTGPSSKPLAEIAEDYSRALGRKISYIDVPIEPWEERLRANAASPHLAAHLIAMAELHRQGRYDRYTDEVRRLTGQPPMSIEEFVRRHRDAFTAGASRAS